MRPVELGQLKRCLEAPDAENAAKTRWPIVIGQIIAGTRAPLGFGLAPHPAAVSSDVFCFIAWILRH